MVVGVTLFVIGVLVVAIWVLFELKRLKHKIFAIVIIGLILFTYASSAIIFKGNNIDLHSIPGVIEAGKIYFSWLGVVTGNVVKITSNAINLNWSNKENKSSENSNASGNGSLFDLVKG